MPMFNFIKKNNELKVFSLNALVVFVKLLCGFLLSKCTAVLLGPQGVGLLANLRSCFNSLQSLTSMGIRKGIVQSVSYSEISSHKLQRIVSTYLFVAFSGAVIIGGGTILFSAKISVYLFENETYQFVIILFALGLFWQVVHIIISGMINAFEWYRKFNLLQISVNILGFVGALLGLYFFNLKGLMYALALIPSLLFLVSLAYYKEVWGYFAKVRLSHFNKTIFKELLGHSVMTLSSALLVPFTLIGIRNLIVDMQGIEAMGYWEAMNRISNYIYVFASSFIGMYWYPKLAKQSKKRTFLGLLLPFYKMIIPPMILGFLVIFIAKEYVVRIVLSEAFLPSLPLFSWQLVGDFFKIISSVLSYQFFAKKMTKDYVITEVISLSIWYLSSVIFVRYYGYLGGAIGYCFTYALYFVLLCFWFRKSLFR